MKQLFTIVPFLLLVSFTWGQFTPELNQYRERVLVKTKDRSDLDRITKANFDVDYCSEYDGQYLFVYATPEEVNIMTEQMDLEVKPAPVEIGESTSRSYNYYTYETLTTKLKELESRYPHLTKLVSIGKSVQGRELWFLKISDNADTNEAEPEIKYISSMHGDEVTGKEMLVFLAEYLLENYETDPWVKQIVDDTEIWLMPSMNPDGTEARRRYNANWVDLNRDFPDVQKGENNDPSGRAIETQHMMNFTKDYNFCISVNCHGGALVANYAWDTMGGDVPDVEFTKFLALGYSKLNTPMFKSPYFKDGITNGYDWYEVNGSMQDWSYNWHNCIEITLELSKRKWPNAGDMPQYWEENRESLLWFIAQARRGVHGLVTDAQTGKPVAAKVNVKSIGKSVMANKDLGDYQRVLMPGTYDIEFSAPGYKTKLIENVLVEDRDTKPTILNVSLEAK